MGDSYPDSNIEVRVVNPRSGEIRVTHRKKYQINGHRHARLDLTNEYFVIENKKYVKRKNAHQSFFNYEKNQRNVNSSFRISIPDIRDTVPSVLPHISITSKLIIETYLSGNFYSTPPSHYSNIRIPDASDDIEFDALDDIEFQVEDFNQDGKSDVMITVPAITGAGSNETVPFKVRSIYFQNNEMSFNNFVHIDEKLADEKTVEELLDICREISFEPKWNW